MSKIQILFRGAAKEPKLIMTLTVIMMKKTAKFSTQENLAILNLVNLP
jgi:hypothetical protein